MKTKIKVVPSVFKTTMVVITCISLLTVLAKAGDSKTTSRQITVKVQPGVDDVKVIVKAPLQSAVQFYIFDVYGKLVKHCEITGSNTMVLQPLSKGTYFYDAFANDSKLKSGNIELK